MWKIFEKGFKTVPEDSPVLPRLAELMYAIGTAMRAVDPQLTASAAKDVSTPERLRIPSRGLQGTSTAVDPNHMRFN